MWHWLFQRNCNKEIITNKHVDERERVKFTKIEDDWKWEHSIKIENKIVGNWVKATGLFRPKGILEKVRNQ